MHKKRAAAFAAGYLACNVLGLGLGAVYLSSYNTMHTQQLTPVSVSMNAGGDVKLQVLQAHIQVDGEALSDAKVLFETAELLLPDSIRAAIALIEAADALQYGTD